MKNIDWVKQMDAEQMANWALDESCNKCAYNAKDCGHIPCKDGVAEWLSSEHEEPLKNCPFCDSDNAKVIGHCDSDGITVGYSVQCMNCGSRTGRVDLEETARKFWNERYTE